MLLSPECPAGPSRRYLKALPGDLHKSKKTTSRNSSEVPPPLTPWQTLAAFIIPDRARLRVDINHHHAALTVSVQLFITTIHHLQSEIKT